ncbi:electron transport complex protein RnfA [Herbinix hemicellulosilytica]|uniref:Ion-translocating oxidoreductase complex subunit A n=1 Tax=Herbinix hemicellulosilytica TaxID=1564487 RepID=A0A0H5SY24_HERHM|nr:electron transport complex subunit RsxA [Herbinix hemicellulosilytica]RBP56842.1 electron transport complex protein RnfA [Herbinix hemicellulosilytica]CRZ35278.1 Electron transport complex protein RnfA [Herbinix hemicellulosilytica]
MKSDYFVNLLLIFISGALINNVILSQFLGICSFLGISNKIKSAIGMGLAVIFVITSSSIICYLLYTFILAPLDLGYLNTIVFIAVIACLVQFVEMVIKKFSPALYDALGVYLPLITTNCAVLGVALLNVEKGYDLVESIVNGFAAALGYTISIILMAGIRERMEYNDIPKTFRGFPITLITATLMAIAFYGFSGLI